MTSNAASTSSMPPRSSMSTSTTAPTSSAAASTASDAKATLKQAKASLHKTAAIPHEVHDEIHSKCRTHVAAQLAAAKIHPPTTTEVMRYRYHHGVNLGSCFVLEKWLTPSMFPQGADTSELAAVTASCNQFGHSATRQKWESHWATMISDTDFEWLVNVAHCTSIRLPIGYWIVGATCTKDTPFEPYAPVYIKAWSFVKKLISRAQAHGIGVLIDFHALPGGANSGDHSGTNNGKAELWTDTKNKDIAIHCILLLTQELRMNGIIGLQLCNEAANNAPGMYEWYDRALTAIALIDSKLPIYISDAWDPPSAIRYTQSKNTSVITGTSVSTASTNPVIIDTHYYWTFSDADKTKTPQQIITEPLTKLSEPELDPSGSTNRSTNTSNTTPQLAVPIIVGEYSCTISADSWSRAPASDRPQLAIQFGQAQCKRWQSRSMGSYFWTYKMDWMDGGEWGFVAQTNSGAITAPSHLLLERKDVLSRTAGANTKRDKAWKAAIEAHKKVCETASAPASPGSAELWRFEAGWEVGFADAAAFFGMRAQGLFDSVGPKGVKITASVGGDKIGNVDLWIRKRVLDSGMVGEFVWMFEKGVREGVMAFYEGAGV